jgi:gluconolactonase
MRRLTMLVFAAFAAGVMACGGAGQALAQAAAPGPVPAYGAIERLDPGLDALIAPGTAIERAATGFKFLESPLWRRSLGVLWFSDVVGNVVYQLAPDGKVTEILNPGGYDGHSLPAGGFIGPNGMAAGPNGTVTLLQHGNRRIVSIAPDHKVTVLLDRYEGQRFNSPNDLVYAPDGSFYFTDPPYGLPKRNDDPDKDMKFNGVFRYANGKLQLLIKDIPTPNGIGFSPDYKTLYLTDTQGARKQWVAYDVTADGGLANRRVFLDASDHTERGALDGLRVDAAGNVWATGPGGIWVISPQGKHLGTIHQPEPAASVTFGDDGKTLYIAATTSLYKLRVKATGQRQPFN